MRIGDEILKFTQDHLKEFTGGFGDENYLDRTESHSFIGNRVYRGKVIIDEESNWVRNVIVEVKEPQDGLEYDVWEVQYDLPLYQILIQKIVSNLKGDIEIDLPESVKPEEILLFSYAPLFSVDVERSFSNYKNMLSDKRCRFTIDNLGKTLALSKIARSVMSGLA